VTAIGALLSPRELESCRREVERTLPSLVEIRRFTSTADGQGGYTETWANVAINVAARIMPERTMSGGPTEGVEADRQSEGANYILTLRWDTDITPRDRVVYEGTEYEVVGVNSGSYVTARRTRLRRVA